MKIMKILIMQFSPSALLCPNILHSALLSNIHDLYSSLRISDQVSDPYKATGKMVF